MNVIQLVKEFNKNKAKLTQEMQEFFADVVLGQGNWEWRCLVNGRKVITHPDAVFSVEEWNVFHKDNAIFALTKLQEELDIDLKEEINEINSSDPVSLRAILPASMLSAMKKTNC